MTTPGGPYSDRTTRGGRPWLTWVIILVVILLVIWLVTAYARASHEAVQNQGVGAAPATAIAALVAAP
jgi:uncharacterized membrane protein YhdT